MKKPASHCKLPRDPGKPGPNVFGFVVARRTLKSNQ